MKFLNFLILMFTCFFSSIHSEELNKIVYYQVNSGVLGGYSIYWISVDVKRYFLTYDDSQNLVIENRGVHSFQINLSMPEINRFYATINSEIQILSESTFKNNQQEAIFILRINGKNYKAFGLALNPASELWDDLPLQVSKVKKLGDSRIGSTTTIFEWRGHSFGVFSDIKLKNGENLTLKSEGRGRTFGESNFIFIGDDGFIYSAYRDSIWGKSS